MLLFETKDLPLEGYHDTLAWKIDLTNTSAYLNEYENHRNKIIKHGDQHIMVDTYKEFTKYIDINEYTQLTAIKNGRFYTKMYNNKLIDYILKDFTEFMES